MTRQELQEKIAQMLQTSTVSLHDKMMVEILMPVMEMGVLEQINTALCNEKEKLAGLAKRKSKLREKYDTLVAKFRKK